MNLEQLKDIHFFYEHLVDKIQKTQKSNESRKRSELTSKTEIKAWLNYHKSHKTFGENCRHEILHTIDLIHSDELEQVERKITNLKFNCKLICEELEISIQERGKMDFRISHYNEGVSYQSNSHC